tara:strand:+ start:104 stop:1336 length:1233 start_codon:yes stop_codon:yes gene_type:complete
MNNKGGLALSLIIIAVVLVIGIGIGVFYFSDLFNREPVPDDPSINLPSGTYKQIRGSSIVNGDLAFSATTINENEVIVYRGNEYGSEYDRVYKPNEIGGKLVYSAHDRKVPETIRYIIHGDRIYTDTKDYYDISYPVDVNGKIAFEAYAKGTEPEANVKSIIIYEGEVYGDEYDWASEIFSVKDKWGYIAQEGPGLRKAFLVFDGEEIGREYNKVESPAEVNGKLAYIADNDKLVYGGEVIAEYDRFSVGGFRGKGIKEVNGKPAVVAVKDDEYFVIHGGKEWKPSQHRTHETAGDSFTPAIYAIEDIGGKLAFQIIYEFCCPDMGDNPALGNLIYYDGKEYGLEYDSASAPFETNGELGYIGRKDSKEFLVIDGEIASEKYDSIQGVQEINGQLIYFAKTGTRYSVYRL